jgi:hypothetical protein
MPSRRLLQHHYAIKAQMIIALLLMGEVYHQLLVVIMLSWGQM